VDVVGKAGGFLLVLMIEAPHFLHTHIRSSLYINNVIQHLLQWLQVIRMQPPLIYDWFHKFTKVVAGGSRRFTWIHHGVALLHLIRAPHTLHTHSRSSSYIYIVFLHLILWLVVTRMQHMLGLTIKVVVVGDSPGFTMGLHCYISLGHLTHFILIAGLLHTYI
jgi:hypothetical protein